MKLRSGWMVARGPLLFGLGMGLWLMGCERCTSKDPGAKPAAQSQQKPAGSAAPSPEAPVASTEPGEAGDGGVILEVEADSAICQPAQVIFDGLIQSLAAQMGQATGELKQVELGDLNGDGKPELARSYVDATISLSFILTEVRPGCYRQVMSATSGILARALTSSTNGWEDLELTAELNRMGGPEVGCNARFLARMGKEHYELNRVIASQPSQEKGEITAEQCKEQAEDIVKNE